MAALSDDVKMFVTQALACYDPPIQVIRAVKQEFGLDVTAQQLQAYNPATVAGARMSKRLKTIFEATRKNFIEGVGVIPIAQQVYRLRVMDRMLGKAEAQGNLPMAAQLLEQAAKETGGAFTNKQKHEHSGHVGVTVAATAADEAL